MKKSSLSVAPYLHYIARLLDVQGVSGSSPLAPTIFCSNVYAQLLLTFRLCVSIKTKYFVLIILILATLHQTIFLYVRHDQICPVVLFRVIPFAEACKCTLICAGYSRLWVHSIVKVRAK